MLVLIECIYTTDSKRHDLTLDDGKSSSEPMVIDLTSSRLDLASSNGSNVDFLTYLPQLEYLEISDDWDMRRDRLEIRKLGYNLNSLLALNNLRWLRLFYIDLVDSEDPAKTVELYRNLLNRLVVFEIMVFTLTQEFAEEFFKV